MKEGIHDQQQVQQKKNKIIEPPRGKTNNVVSEQV